jgi:hypothetical protein
MHFPHSYEFILTSKYSRRLGNQEPRIRANRSSHANGVQLSELRGVFLKQVREFKHRCGTLGTGIGTPWTSLECCLRCRDGCSDFGFTSYLNGGWNFGAVEGVDERESFSRFGVNIL